jgi:dolichyl-phosphate-mannose--protein O-mannosyl transferase
LWIIKGPDGKSPCLTGEKVKCGDMIRLEHMNTGKNIHTHNAFASPVSHRQEVTGYGDDGDGDTSKFLAKFKL